MELQLLVAATFRHDATPRLLLAVNHNGEGTNKGHKACGLPMHTSNYSFIFLGHSHVQTEESVLSSETHMVSYALAAHSWPSHDVVTILSRDDQLIGTFPCRFLAEGGVNSWQFINSIVNQLVRDADEGVIRGCDGAIVLRSEAPSPGPYVFESLCEILSPSRASVLHFSRSCHSPSRSLPGATLTELCSLSWRLFCGVRHRSRGFAEVGTGA